jgi:NADH-quinone oxidoreductase subunit F
METTKLLLTRSPEQGWQGLEEYCAEGGYEALRRILQEGIAPEAIIQELEKGRLRGRGGAGFPVARKWKIAAGIENEHKFVIANGGEHEPGSKKDHLLLENYPHKVLEGLLLAAYATGAKKGFVYMIDVMEEARASVEKAIEELKQAGLLGAQVLGTEFSLDLHIHLAPPTYVAGEETAVIDSIEGGPAKPRGKPPYPSEAGIYGKPTTINNVETLAQTAALLRMGGAEYAKIGTEESKGTMLLTLGGRAKNPGVYEVPYGTSYRYLIEELGGGTRSGKAIRALQPAMSCSFLGEEGIDLPISFEALAEAGSSLGCGGISWIEEGQDPLPRLLTIAKFFSDSQCGQCPPCNMITGNFLHVMQGVKAGKPGDFAGAISKISAFAVGKGRCGLPSMDAAPLASGIRLFQKELAARLEN